MDWSKTKNILIVAFTITNLILLFVLGKNMMHDGSFTSVDQDFVLNVKTELMKKNIMVESEIPRKIPSIPLLTLRYETHDPYNLAKTMMNDKEYAVQNYGNKMYFQSPNEILTIDNKNKIVYGNKDRTKVFSTITKELAENIATKFLSSRNFEKDYKLIEYKELNGIHTLIFKPVYKGMLIENDEIYMKFDIDNTGIKRFERTWLEIVRLKDKEISVASAPDTLLKLLSQNQYYNKDIIDIELCYRFEGDSITTKEGDAYPSWRIKFSDDTIIILK